MSDYWEKLVCASAPPAATGSAMATNKRPASRGSSSAITLIWLKNQFDAAHNERLLILSKLDDLHKEHLLILSKLDSLQPQVRFDYAVGPITSK